jgi:hypothetical protein
VKRPDQPPQLPPDGALIRRMDAYLSGESAEATAIIKDARAALQSRQPADIRRAQIEAGEAAVVASLAGTGLRWGAEPAAPVAPVAAVPASPTPPVQPTSEALTIAVDALDEIALSGMSGSGQESEEGMRAWHARRAWEFIGIAARAKEAVKALTAAQAEGGSK